MKEIPLSKGKVAIVDDEDYEKLRVYPWYASRCSRRVWYAYRSVREGKRKRTIKMHTEIMGRKLIDHKNGNGLDNRRENLRPATPSQNGANRGKNKDSLKKYKGVFKVSRGPSWMAVIRTKGKGIYIGSFPNEELAAEAYDKKASEIFGEFARLNFPPQI